MADDQYDFLIIGAGFAGLATGAFLADGGRLLVVEQEFQPGYHSSGRSAAVYIEPYENPAVHALTCATRRAWEQEDWGEGILSPRGMLNVGIGEGSEAAMDAYLQRWHGLCPELRLITAGAAAELVPVIDAGQSTGAVYDPTALSIDTSLLLDLYRRRIARFDGELRTNTEVTGLARDGNGWRATTTSGEITASCVVNAAGAWASQIGALAGSHVATLEPRRRTAVLIEHAAHEYTNWPAVSDILGRFYFKPEAGLLMASLADEVPSPPVDAQPEELAIAEILDTVSRLTHLSPNRPHTSWAGLRTFAPDRRHVAGPDPDLEGFWWLAGQGGSGVQTSAATGALLATMITGDAAPAWLDLDADLAAEISPARLT